MIIVLFFFARVSVYIVSEKAILQGLGIRL